ncbi:hypothetical protein AURDEDRAFT_114882 [Auricularia subglabra TFB-10046 SS5]|nr:hypothetical protein AURDEDRAFT_114882 [Auricularia subglabra TFB-10046 SS5]
MSIQDNYVRHPKWKRLPPELRQRWDAATARGAFALGPEEKPWRDRVPFLLTKGYRLRARFQPNWVPSWKGTDIHPKDCEDSIRFTGKNVMDGKRIEDNKIVAIKHMRRSSKTAQHEVEITRLCSSLPGGDNRCIPFVDAFEDVATDSLYLVTEWTVQFNTPEFFNGAEVADFVQQMLDGLTFLHRHGIVHRDIRPENLRMDIRPLTPGVTPHPQLPLHALDAAPVSEPLRRSEAPRIRYFIGGFAKARRVGIDDALGPELYQSPRSSVDSRRTSLDTRRSTGSGVRSPVPLIRVGEEEDDAATIVEKPREGDGLVEVSEEEAKKVEAPDAKDEGSEKEKEAEVPAPEADVTEVVHESPKAMHEDLPSPPLDKGKGKAVDADLPPPPPPEKDPYAVDVYDFGVLLTREFIDKYSNMDWLQPLLDTMTTMLPDQRYSAADALYFIGQIRQYMDFFEAKWALKRRDATVGDAMVNGLYTGLNLLGVRKFRWQARIQDPMLPDPGS